MPSIVVCLVCSDGPLRLPGEGVLVVEAIWEISLCPCETRGLRGPVRDCALLVFFFVLDEAGIGCAVA